MPGSTPKASVAAGPTTPDMYANAIAKYRPAVDLEIKLCPVPESVRKARNFVRDNLIKLGYPALVDNGILIASELVTNSLHAAPESPLWVDLRWAGGLLVLEVWDCSPKPPVLKEPDSMTEGGRGMRVVGELSNNRLGCDPFPFGKVVWVVLG